MTCRCSTEQQSINALTLPILIIRARRTAPVAGESELILEALCGSPQKTLLDFGYLPLLARRVEKTFDDCNARCPQSKLLPYFLPSSQPATAWCIIDYSDM
ncbi:hypothetical protein Y032_0260g517 [Ancylostoma ceylanicum]|uniref:Uncharacterized protein n=1 Tax=Ancylostoma ceylanicum TaxID=53326 RepID=A0A016SAD8_9BILA|nr:hypothetical protein Y032_0260g517 [Ancylostoma ceylanicum]